MTTTIKEFFTEAGKTHLKFTWADGELSIYDGWGSEWDSECPSQAVAKAIEDEVLAEEIEETGDLDRDMTAAWNAIIGAAWRVICNLPRPHFAKLKPAIDYQFARQSAQPAWFDPHNPLHLSATMGSSQFNEWWAFNSRADAVEVLYSFSNQSFDDQFVWHDGEIFRAQDRLNTEHAVTLRDGAQPADLAKVAYALSIF